jgi:hypothetical protein
MRRASAVTAIALIFPAWPLSQHIDLPVSTSHTPSFPSSEPDTAIRPSGVNIPTAVSVYARWCALLCQKFGRKDSTACQIKI